MFDIIKDGVTYYRHTCTECGKEYYCKHTQNNPCLDCVLKLYRLENIKDFEAYIKNDFLLTKEEIKLYYSKFLVKYL
jgi:hypothetical protein